MAKVLVLAPSGFGKSTSIGKIDEFKIKGLNPKETYIISATSKPLPFKGSGALYPIDPEGQPPKKGHRYISNKGNEIAKVIRYVLSNRKEIKNIVIDDSNYVMQDYYMAHAKKKGYDIFKEIGAMMNDIFSAMEESHDVNIFMLAHYEEYKDSSTDSVAYRFKTVGKMTQDYITPEGKFDVVLFGKSSFDEQEKKASKHFVTNHDGQFAAAKSPVGMFDEIYILNDLGLVAQKVKEYYG